MSTSRTTGYRTRPARRLAAAVLAMALGATACVSSDEDAGSTPTTDLSGDRILLTSALETVDNCDALLDRIKTEALERVGPYGFGNGFYGPIIGFEGGEEAMEDDAMAADGADFARAETTAAAGDVDASAQSNAGGGESFTGTNNQEEGVDEADLVKTDGERLIIVAGNQLRIIDATTDVPQLVDTVQLPEDFYGGELFLQGDTALLMTSGWTSVPLARTEVDAAWYPGSSIGRIIEIDLASGEVGRTLEFEGGYLSAREIDGSIRIVMSAAENRFNFVFPSNPGAEESAENANRDLIENSTIEMWVPSYRITDGGETVAEGAVVDCDRVHLPTEFAGFGSLVVMTANIDEGLRIDDSLSVFTDGQTVYASQDRLAVATPRWPEFDNDGQPIGTDGYRTAIHSFDISDPVRSDYAASGSVRGFLLNRFSMSEHEGFLRVATTDGTPWDSRGSESYVTVLEEQGGELAEIGQVGGLGRGETIFAVRFLGDKGYVVTFEQIDPLYTVDLSDPTNPTVEGELKITGVSDYLHPYGQDLVIGVGRDGDDNGLTGPVAVSVFDVSDPTNPTRLDNLTLGVQRPENPEFGWADSYTPIQNDARAFTMWNDTMVIPVGWWSYIQSPGNFQENNGNVAALVRIDPDSGTLTKVGEIGHPNVTECGGGPIPVDRGPGGVVVFTGSDTAAAAVSEAIASGQLVEEAPAQTEPPATEDTGDAEASFVTDDAVAEVEAVEPGGEEFCYKFQPEIRRSVVIGDDLYTISDNGVAVNRFDGLDTVTWIPFER
ncbi:MAG: beta-propeller domain-containing protein [Actinomycetota bacterium]